MTEQAKKYLFDILYAIEVIEEFLKGTNFFEYKTDSKTKNINGLKLALMCFFCKNYLKLY